MKMYIYFLISLLSSLSLFAQNDFWQKDIEIINANLRTPKSVVLGELEVDAPSDGYVIVKFEGNVWSSAFDRIVLAASDAESWFSNDGNIGVDAYDSTHIINYFSHSRLYPVSKGLKKFYAVGQNFVDLGGNGRATIKGRLTVEFIASSANNQVVKAKGSIIYPVLLSSKEKRIDSLSIQNKEEGKLIVIVDGVCNGDTKEELLLSSSLDGQWNQENENITMIQNVSYNTQLFEYCKIYDVTPGTQNVYLLSKKLKGDSTYDRNGFIYNFNLQFIPNDRKDFTVHHQEIAHELKKNDANKTCGELIIPSKDKGKALVTFIGNSQSALDDILSLTLINSTKGFSDSTKILAQPNVSHNNYVFYQINAILDLEEGQNSFKIIGDFEPNSSGNGSASIYGTLIVKIISDDSSTGIHENTAQNDADILYPNPTTGFIHFTANNQLSSQPVLIFDQSGKLVSSGQYKVINDNSIDMQRLQNGIYFVKLGNENRIYKVVKNSDR